MKTQKLQFALASLHNLQKKKKKTKQKKAKQIIKKCPTVIIKANKNMLM